MLRTVLFTLLLVAGEVTAQQKTSTDEHFKFKHMFKPYAHPWLSSTSINFGFGLTAYAGEVGKIDDLSRQNSHFNPNVNLGVQRRFTDYLSWRLEGAYYKLYAEPGHNQLPVNKFVSHNFDYYAALVVDTKPRPDFDSRYKKWNIYFFAGVGQTYFNPINPDTKEEIAPENDKLTIIFPIGAGIMYFKSDFVSFGFEINRKFTTTDYLDGEVINNTYPKNDNYLFYGFKMNLKVFNKFKYSSYLKRNSS